jgi:amino acid adenylation domain-containing protein
MASHDLLAHLPDHSALRWPDKDAFRCGNKALSHAELARRSSQLANALIAHGVVKGDRVGIYLDKSLESAIALFGIMKAGAAYVPLDPAAPAARLEYMINHCGIRIVVSASNKAASLHQLSRSCPTLEATAGLSEPAGEGLTNVCWEEIRQAPDHSPDAGLRSHDLAYIMFTSGSTGTPKGMMHTHGSGLAYARAARDLYDVRPEDRLGNHSPLHFDMSTFEYFCGPLAGATSVIIPEAYTRMPASLSQLMEKERLSFWYSVPFALIQLLLRGVLDQRDLTSLRWVMFGGEPFPPKYLAELMARWPQARFSNVYGPAEVNQCTFHHLSAPPADADAPIPIGRIWNAAQGLVVDEADQPVTAGGTGELLIRSDTMMQGYWSRPDLNARAFFQATGDADGGRYYRTGDLVQTGPDGTLHFMGRKDRLVKVRGYRVELDEVELVLGSHEAVEEAAVFASMADPESPELEAAVILKPSGPADTGALRDFVATRMPPYGVPSRIHALDSFPRTTSGKIDRRALQARFA